MFGVAALATAVLALGGCGDSDEGASAEGASGKNGKALTEVNLLVDFFPGGIQGPIFAAIGEGFFREEGLDVSLDFSPTAASVQNTIAGKGDLAYAPTAILLSARQESGVDMKMLYSFQQTSPMAVLATDESGIDELSDLKGKTVVDFAGSATQLLWPLVLERNGMSTDDVEMRLVDPASRIKATLAGQADAMIGFWPDNAPLLEDACKCNVNIIKFDESGVPQLGSGFSATPDFIADNRDLLRRFFRAVTKGAMFASQDQATTVEDVAGVVGEDDVGDFDVAAKIVENLITQYRSPASKNLDLPLGSYAPEDWEQTVDILAEAGGIEPVDDVSSLYTNDFVPCHTGSTLDDLQFVRCSD